jgi:hypothetical protein
VIAHVGALPLEELIGSGGALLVARAWIMVRLRREHGR